MENFGGRVHNVIMKRSAKELERLLRLNTDENDHHGLHVNFLELAEDDPELADALLKHPRSWLAEVEDMMLYYGLVQAQLDILDAIDPAFKQARESAAAASQPAPRHTQLTPKRVLHLRLVGLPQAIDPSHTALRPTVSDIGTSHLNKLVVVTGTVVRTGSVRMFKSAQDFQCTRCKWATRVRCKLEDGGVAPAPEACSNPQPCIGTKFKMVQEGQMFSGFQEIKVQEKAACLAMGALPASIPAVLQDELVDKLQCGDDVEVVGIVTARWQPMIPSVRCEAELVLVAHNVHVLSKRQGRVMEVHDSTAAKFMAFWDAHKHAPITGRNKILAGICPQIHGMYLVKLAMALSLVGGVARPDEHLRGDVHLLVIGDPGIGKSQVMKFAAKAAHRSVVASGRGTSGAGLTAAAVKDGGVWVLEAGALVLADGGVCCIDEFDGIKECDRTMMHEAMEQQTVHVAKAGMMTTLSTRTTVVAAVNPKAGWVPSQPLSAATNISGPLLSRFDIVLLLLDVHHPERDRNVALRVLDNHQQGAQTAQAQQQASNGGSNTSSSRGIGNRGSRGTTNRSGEAAGAGMLSCAPTLATSQLEGAWSMDVLKAYLLWAKLTWQPVMTRHAEAVIQAYYQTLRQNEDRSAARTTIRMLESLVRVAQAHARLCARSQVTLQDAVMAVIVVDTSQNCLRLMSAEAALASDFPSDPDGEYSIYEQRVLRELGLSQQLAIHGHAPPLHLPAAPAAPVQGAAWAQRAGVPNPRAGRPAVSQPGWPALQAMLTTDRPRQAQQQQEEQRGQEEQVAGGVAAAGGRAGAAHGNVLGTTGRASGAGAGEAVQGPGQMHVAQGGAHHAAFNLSQPSMHMPLAGSQMQCSLPALPLSEQLVRSTYPCQPQWNSQGGDGRGHQAVQGVQGVLLSGAPNGPGGGSVLGKRPSFGP